MIKICSSVKIVIGTICHIYTYICLKVTKFDLDYQSIEILPYVQFKVYLWLISR